MIDADLIPDLRRSFQAALDHDEPARARAALLEGGWLDALELDEAAAAALVFREQGRRGCETAALDDLIARRLAAAWPEASGDLAVAHPVAAPAGRRPSHALLPGRDRIRRLLWVADLHGEELAILELDAALEAPALGGIDPDAGWIGLSSRPAGKLTRLEGARAARAWEPALAAGRVALAHQLAAGARALLESATAYAEQRRQFGAPIASFQAVKHRLADTLVAICAADAATVAAASTGTPTAAAVAKVLAGRAAAVAGKNCLQVFGGIGFTLEHDFHPHFRRHLVLERLLGDRRRLERELGAQLRCGALHREHVVELADEPRLELL